jgi:hypothetical protein
MTNSPRNKKKGLRQVVFFWLLLILLEGGFSGLCGEYQETAKRENRSFACLLQTTPETGWNEFRVSSQAQDSHSSGCTDECFCHMQMLPAAFSATQTALTLEDRSLIFSLIESQTQTLTPPFLPPKSV